MFSTVPSNIKVLHVGGCPLPPEIPSSALARLGRHPGRWVLDLCIAQNQPGTGFEAALSTLVRRLSRSFDTTMDGIPVHLIASRTRARLLRGYREDRRNLAKLVSRINPDIIHAHGFEDAYALAAQDTKLPYVITAQGLMFMIIPMLKPPLRSWLRIIRIYEHIALKRAKHVIAKSDTVAKALEAKYPHLVLHRIPNTFDPRLLHIKETREPNTLVFVGIIDPRKGLHLITEALGKIIRKIPDIQLWVIGDRGKSGSEYEINQIRILRNLLGNRLKTFGRVPGLEVGKIVARATALVAPSLEEMFGNQLIEALLVGTHGIVTEGTGLEENARRFGNATIVPQLNSTALSQSIFCALKQADFPERDQARQRIINFMGPEVVTQFHRKVYEQILDSSRFTHNKRI